MRTVAGGERSRGHFRSRQRPILLTAFVIATLATLGSLTYGLYFHPCELCWWQRLCMYPLVPLLGSALRSGWREVYKPLGAVAAIGGAIAAYHSYLQATAVTCGFGGCGAVQFRLLGLSIPNQALIAFGLLTGCATLLWRADDTGDR